MAGPEDSKPRLLDLFCGAGGAAKGYQRAGFYVVGVDHKPQPRYCGDEFVQADALEALAAGGLLDGFAAVHAAPLWFQYARTGNYHHLDRPDDVTAAASLLVESGLPYVCESGTNGPLLNTVKICGASLGLEIVRHMSFQTNFPIMVPPCGCPRNGTTTGALVAFGAWSSSRVKYGRALPPRRKMSEWIAAADVGWMTGQEAGLASPPAYTEHIGSYLIAEVERRSREAVSCV